MAGAGARARHIVQRPRLLAVLALGGATLVVGVVAVGFSGAYFTATSVDGGSTIAAGSVQLQVTPTADIVDGTDLAPGVSRAGSVEVVNLRSPVAVTLEVADLQMAPSDAGLDAVLVVEVRETAPEQVVRYRGTLRDLHGAPLTTLGEGARATYQLVLSWPPEQTDPSLRDVTASFAFEWIATST